LEINLTSDKDVDIRLYDNDTKIVHWPYGLLSGGSAGTVSYNETNISYSGFNGVNGELGHEYIRVDGVTQSLLTMKAFGYKAGYATVEYSWTGKEGCSSTSGEGNFTQSLNRSQLSLVGEIPEDIDNVYVSLESDKDLDIQLYGADGTVIVGWKPTGLISGPIKDIIDYNGMHIEWSGYNGVNNQKGHEYIKITGKTTEELTMKVYGYEGGIANVTYSWGDDNNQTHGCEEEPYEPVCGQYPNIQCTSPAEGMDGYGCGTIFNNMCELEEANATLLPNGQCQGLDTNESQELHEAKELWDSKNITNYTFSLYQDTGIPVDGYGYVIVEVRDNKVVHAIGQAPSTFPGMEFEVNASDYMTIDKYLNNFIPSLINEGNISNILNSYQNIDEYPSFDINFTSLVQYDAEYGYPTRIITSSYSPMSNNITYISDLKILENNTEIPENCTVWYDGCNECKVIDGNLTLCTEMACIGTNSSEDIDVSSPYCVSYTSVDFDPICGTNPSVNCMIDFNGNYGTCNEKTYSSLYELHNAGAEYIHDGECNTTTVCIPDPMGICLTVFDPVCGQIDGQEITYSNSCELSNACATLLYAGECNGTIPPPVEPCTKEYVPVCGKTTNIQCITEPCEFNQTFGNMCLLNNDDAQYLYDGECKEENNNSQSSLQNELDQNMELWDSKNIHDYKMIAEASVQNATGSVEVINDSVTSIIDPSSYNYPANASYIHKTIDDYFELISSLLVTDPNDLYSVTYDSTYGFPSLIYTKDVNYTLSSFEILNIPVCGTMDFNVTEFGMQNVECYTNKTGCEEITYPSQNALEEAGAAYIYWGECTGKSQPCTNEYVPACGQNFNLPNSPFITYSNTCMLQSAGAHFEYDGECQDENNTTL